jgi:hypothetical protein
MPQKTGNFDFAPINALTNDLPAGMKLAIAQGLISNCIGTFNRFKNECEDEAKDVAQSLQNLREAYKKTVPADKQAA